MIIIIKKTIF